MKLEKYVGNPILSPLECNEWESLVTCNPGVIYDGDRVYLSEYHYKKHLNYVNSLTQTQSSKHKM